ncbi:TPA: hypothetical protein HA239_06280 [Candidatus Woesearchaeota archaeon]|nr:hypothetical protein QT06_C0001G0853 [archaeon GW2011_AR15]MBS3103368.1 hypothetical protein [Candidatus Woesearchaeota archaeon]HIH41982.1 hypothetical protein [Candidatus Woesearchaeota archaeon]
MAKKKKKSFWEKVRANMFFIGLKKEFWNKEFGILAISIFAFWLIWSKDLGKFWKALSFIPLIITYWIYTIKITSKRESYLFSKAYNFFIIGLLILLEITYLAAISNEIIIAVSLLVFIPAIILLGIILYGFRNVFLAKKAKRGFIVLLSSYLLLSFSIILLFAYSYNIIDVFPNNDFITPVGVTISSLWDYVYFTFLVQYSADLGGIYFIGNELKSLFIIQVAFSIIFNAFTLKDLIDNMK